MEWLYENGAANDTTATDNHGINPFTDACEAGESVTKKRAEIKRDARMWRSILDLLCCA